MRSLLFDRRLTAVGQVEELKMTEADKRQEIWAIMRTLGKKAYVQLKTSLGDLNLEVRAI